jgi:hypothetical protein
MQTIGAPPSLPAGFVSIEYPGYFWHVPSQSLWTMKVDGILKPMKSRNIPYYIARQYNLPTQPCYQLSVGGRKKIILEAKFKTRFKNHSDTIPTVDTVTQ